MYEFNIQNMTCGHCKGTVEKAIRARRSGCRRNRRPRVQERNCRNNAGPGRHRQGDPRRGISGVLHDTLS